MVLFKVMFSNCSENNILWEFQYFSVTFFLKGFLVVLYKVMFSDHLENVGLVTERLQVQIHELTRYKSVVLPLNRQLTHCS
jgi:hypothetical protein